MNLWRIQICYPNLLRIFTSKDINGNALMQIVSKFKIKTSGINRAALAT
jgi:hypothetical protein